MIKSYNLLGKFLLISLICVSSSAFAKNNNPGLPDDKKLPSLLPNSKGDAPVMRHIADSIYDLIALQMYGLEREVFFSAYKGYQYLQKNGRIKKENLLTICDYSQSSNNKRLYVIDLLNSRLLYNTFVSHGKNSGGEYATSFSNMRESNKSSIGFMVTGETYSGKAGYSMRFDGMEANINDKVRSRDIVLHGSYFVNERIRDDRGTIGKSLGCPAVPMALHKQIINAIKGGSCYFINSADSYYSMTSTILNSKFDIAPLNLTATAIAGNNAIVDGK